VSRKSVTTSEGKLKNGVYRRGSSYYIQVKVNGTRHRKSFGPDRKKAELVLAEIKKQRAFARVTDDWSGVDKVFKKSVSKTFAEAAADYLAERQHYKPSTLSKYDEVLRNHLLPEFGPLQVSRINEESIAKLQSRLAAKLAARTTNSIMQLLRSILRVCRRRKVIAENPAEYVDRIKEQRTEVNPLSREELDRVLAAIDSHYQPLFICLAWTGARPNELQALRWSDVDFTRSEIHINKGRVRGKEGLPKTPSSNRYIPMLPPVQSALKQLEDLEVKNVNGYVFLSKKWQPINKHLDRIWRRALKSTGLRHRPSYQLRHTFASICLQEGVHPGWVSKVLGHSDQQTVFRHYARFINDAFKENERKLAGLFQRSPNSQAGSA